jgi:cytochrome c oxidase cbb3-type subunit 3
MKSRSHKFTIGILSLIAALPVTAQQQAGNVKQQAETIYTNTAFNIMLAICVLLLFVIIGLAQVVQAGGRRNLEQAKKKKQKENTPLAGLMLILFLGAAATLQAQATSPANVPAINLQPFNFWGMGAQTFYLMLIVILFEALIAAMLFRSGMQLVKSDAVKKALIKERTEPSLLEKLNASVAVEEEGSILTNHEYDGIRELDNDLPPWWKYGFYLTIVVAIVYLFHFHVFNTGKLSLAEYEQEMKDGDVAVAEYQKNSKDLVDENTVKLLTDAASIAEGKAIFKEMKCGTCHGEFAEGQMAPNLTDDYWIYGGSVNDIFRSVKYGRANGMKSWKGEIGPAKIQALASYIKSLRGTNPPNAKEKQGELYVEAGQKPVSDSAASVIDSLAKPGIDSIKK